jgi:UDP-N-acetylglucosamine 2-epimerase (non-hydrolysing)
VGTVVHLVAGARPNFMKIAPVHRALAATSWAEPVFVHTGQHYDESMSDVFLDELGLPRPAIHLEVGSGTHGAQTAAVLERYERACLEHRPDWVVVPGDVNGTLAAALAATKLHIPVAHLEAGLRSGDRAMPEEINRIATDAIADLLWTPSEDADEHLRREGIPEHRIERVGNVMIDSFEHLRPAIEATRAHDELGLPARGYALVTLHRPSNVDEAGPLEVILHQLAALAAELPVVFAVHPRTRARMDEFGFDRIVERQPALRLVAPLPYIRFMSLVVDAALVVTDSGGIQEETTYLGIPCVTLRTTTERPITVTRGTNRLAEPPALLGAATAAIDARPAAPSPPPLWDGHAAERAVASLDRHR